MLVTLKLLITIYFHFNRIGVVDDTNRALLYFESVEQDHLTSKALRIHIPFCDDILQFREHLKFTPPHKETYPPLKQNLFEDHLCTKLSNFKVQKRNSSKATTQQQQHLLATNIKSITSSQYHH